MVRRQVRIFADGAAKKNPEGPGGYGTIVRYLKDDCETIEKVEEFAEGFDVTSNNRMELMGVIVGIESLKEPSNIIVTSDSSYVVKAFNDRWIDKWQSNGWKTSTNKDVKNIDLWKRLLCAMNPHVTNFIWIKGHNGHVENERCDYLASSFAEKKPMEKVDGLYIEKDIQDDK